MYDYFITYHDANDCVVGTDVIRKDVFVSPFEIMTLPLNIPEKAERVVVSATNVSDTSICYIACYSREVNNG